MKHFKHRQLTAGLLIDLGAVKLHKREKNFFIYLEEIIA